MAVVCKGFESMVRGTIELLLVNGYFPGRWVFNGQPQKWIILEQIFMVSKMPIRIFV